MLNTDKPIWLPYPEYPFIEANQFGEVRTKDRVVTDRNGRKLHIKGRVLKQQLNNQGYMYVHVSANGRRFNLLVHRIVATCFLPNPNNLPEVNHKDNNPANNAVSNLEWCTRQYNEDYKKKFGTSSTEVLGRPVFAVNLKTGKVLRFESQCEAARKLSIDQGSIARVVKGLYKYAGNYWFTEDENEITDEKIQEIKNNILSCSVIAVNQETFEVFWFKSQSEAARQLDVNSGNLNSVLKGKRHKTAGGYWFTYADENAIEKTRVKFGDDIANKVEKLMNECRN